MANTKTWFITGASRGFGLDITKAVLATGDQVIATVRSKGEELARQFDNQPGFNLFFKKNTGFTPAEFRKKTYSTSSWYL